MKNVLITAVGGAAGRNASRCISKRDDVKIFVADADEYASGLYIGFNYIIDLIGFKDVYMLFFYLNNVFNKDVGYTILTYL